MATPAPVDTSSFTPQQLAAFNTANALGTGVQTVNTQSPANQIPASQTPVAPTQQLQTPAVPATSTTTQPTTPTTQGTAQGQLAMPANGSVVDLLNAAGQDASFAARQQLAQQYGIQNYSGTAAQNSDLANKYLASYNASKGTQVPQNAADARSALGDSLTNTPGQTASPEQQFMDSFSGMNPVQSNLFSQLSTLLSTQNTQTSLVDLFKQESAAQGLPELNLQLADINKIMDGTEDDIRAEITNAGGFATESSVQALTGARNKTLLKQASYLSNVINAKNDYVKQIVSLTGEDRQAVSEDLDRKIGITKTLFDMSTQMENAAKSNYQSIVDSVGWGGLAQTLQGNPTQTKAVESLFGLAPGELQALASYKKPLTDMEQLELTNQKLQNQKLLQDLSPSGKSTNLQFVAGTANQSGGVFNPTTGVFTPTQGTRDNTLGLAQSQQNITDIQSLVDDPNLSSAVGPNPLARVSLTNLFTGGKSNFIAGIQQMQQQLTLQNLQNAKNNGATFGALSEGELNLLAQSASKLGTWAIKDKNGNITGYNTDEKDFKTELDKINNFAKLDYVLKGGDPSSVSVQQMADGTFWTQNSNGTYTQLK